MNRRYLVLAYLAAQIVACAKTPATFSEVTVALPLAVQNAEYRRLRITQLGQTREYEIDARGEAQAQVVAGVPLDLEITVLGLDRDGALPAVALYTSRRSLTPQAGAVALDITLAREVGQQGSVVPVYEINGVRYPVSATITITDVATGIVFGDWHPQVDEPFELALGRAYEIRIDSLTDAGGAVVFPLSADVFAPATEIPITPPSLPLTSIQLPAAGDFNVALLAADTRLAFECSTDPACADTANYQTTVPLISGFDHVYELGCRYQSAPTLCFAVTVQASSKVPVVDLVASPPYLPATSTSMTVELRADEPVRAESAHLYRDTTELCVTPVAVNAYTVRCDFDSSLLTSSPSDLVGSVANLFGNVGEASLRLRSVTPSQAILIAGAKIYPSQTAGGDSFLLGLDVVGLAPATQTSCAGVRTNISYTLLSAPAGVPLPTRGSTSGDFPAVDVDFTVDSNGAPGRLTLWTHIDSGDSGTPIGNYSIQFDLTADTCGNDTAVFNLTVEPAVIRWATSDGRLVYSSWSRTGAVALPVNALPFSYASSNSAAVLPTSVNGAAALDIVAPGTALVTAYASSQDTTGSTAEIEAALGPPLAFLQIDSSTQTALGTVVVLDNSTVSQTTVNTAIGTPLRLLWEPESNQLIVVGTTGLAAVPPATLLVTGFSATIADAVLVPRHGSGNARIAVLLTDRTFTFVDLPSGAIAKPIAFAFIDCPATPNKIAYHAVSRELTVLALDCAYTYRFPHGATDVAARSLSPLAQSFTEMQADSTTAYFVGSTATAGDLQVFAAATGPAVDAAGPFVVYVDDQPTVAEAFTLNPRDGTPIVAGWHSETQTTAIVSFQRLETASLRTLASLPNTRVQRLLVDATDGVLFVVTSDTPARLLTLDLDTGAALSLPTAVPTFITAPVNDALVMAPQVLSVSGGSVATDGLVTLRGTGFPTNGTATAFLQGVVAPIVSVSPTTLIARVPAALADVPFGMSLEVGVRVHGRLVQSRIPTTLINEPTLLQVSMPASTFCNSSFYTCPGSVEPSTTLSSPYANVIGFEFSGIYDASLVPLASNSGINLHPAFAGDGRRVLGHRDFRDTGNNQLLSRSWIETRADLYEERLFAMASGTVIDDVVEIVADPSNRLLALRGGTSLLLYQATDYYPASALVTLANSSSAAVITPDGQTLMVLEHNGSALSLEAFDLSVTLSPSTTPPLLTTQVAAACPTTVPSFAALSINGSTQPGAASALFISSGTLVLGALERTASSVALTCAQQYQFSAAPTRAAYTASGRMVAVLDVQGYLNLLDPTVPRVSGAGIGPYGAGSIAFTPEQPLGGTSLLKPTSLNGLYSFPVR